MTEFLPAERDRDVSMSLDIYQSPPPILAVVSGPSGVGKDSVIALMREKKQAFHFVVTATDRAPREGEVDGEDYFFLDTAEFERMIRDDEFLEHALVYHQHKGVPKSHARQALDSGLDVVMRLDVQGADTVRRQVSGAVTIFIAPPSLDTLLTRLRRRAGDSAEQLNARLETALAEMRRMVEFDYVVINWEDRLDQTVADIIAIMRAEKLRANRPEIAF